MMFTGFHRSIYSSRTRQTIKYHVVPHRGPEVPIHLPLDGGHLPVHVAAQRGPRVQHRATQGRGVAAAGACAQGLVAGGVAVGGGVARHAEAVKNYDSISN